MGLRLKDKVAIVTGSTKGIGYGFAKGMAQEGAKIVVVSRNQADCDRVAEELRGLGAEALACATDVTDMAAVDNLVKKTLDTFGRIDILVNNAGSALTKRAEDITESEWDHVLGLDLKSVFFCAQAVGKVMIEQKSGKIVNVASMLGLVGEKQVLPYCVAKAGVVQMTRCLALEWAKHNIQVNSLCPGYVITPMNKADLENEKISKNILRKVALRRFAQVEEMVGACIFLASSDSSYMTGHPLAIDGGWTCE